jgi:release factor glutamine methyltransferase
VPRPETETLVEATLAAVREHPNARRLVRVADVGTGCGTVALAVAKHAPAVKMFAIDDSTAALEYAGRNRRRFGLMERVVLLTGSLLDPVGERLDVVAANLPYIPTEEYEHLPPEIRAHEPREAVDGGEDGLEAVRALIAQLQGHLAEGAVAVLMELGPSQTGEVGELLQAALDGSPPVVHRDLAGNRRVVEVRRGYS